MTYLLDTNACIRILNNSNAGVVSRFRQQSPQTIRLCSIVKAELEFGARKSQQVADTLRKLERFFAPLTSLPFDDESAQSYGAIRSELEAAASPIGANDLLIAAIARSHDLTVVTHNASEFRRVVGLRVQDWENLTSSGNALWLFQECAPTRCYFSPETISCKSTRPSQRTMHERPFVSDALSTL